MFKNKAAACTNYHQTSHFGIIGVGGVVVVVVGGGNWIAEALPLVFQIDRDGKQFEGFFFSFFTILWRGCHFFICQSFSNISMDLSSWVIVVSLALFWHQVAPLKKSGKMIKCKNGGFCWITDFNTKWNICDTYYTQVQLLWLFHKLEIFVSVWKVRSMNSSLNRKYLPPKILFDSDRKLKVDIRLIFWLCQKK